MAPFIRRLLRLPAKGPYTGAGSAGHGRPLGADAVQDFVYHGGLLIVASEHHESATYSLADKKLVIRYDGGVTWAYDPISEAQAIAYARADSKGTWMWSNVFIRGKGNKGKHRCNAHKVKS